MLLFVLFFAQAKGQNSTPIPLQISILDEGVHLPNTLIDGLWSPGLQIGTEFTLNQSIRHQIGIKAYLGGFYHRRVSRQFYIGTQFFYRFQPGRFRLQLNLGSAVGNHQFPRDIHQVQEDGSFNTVKDKGRWQLLPTVGLQFAYQINKKEALRPIFIFTQYDLMAQLQFIDSVDLLPHTLLHIGVEFYPF